jgi:hypothetical protein
LPAPNDLALSLVIVKAMKLLTPSPRGPIRELEIRGGLVDRTNTPILLTRSSRGVVNGALSRLPRVQESRVTLEGSVRELDADKMSFILRDQDKEGDKGRECRFDFELWDNIYELLGVDVRVVVLGIQTSPTSPIHVIDLFLKSE